MTAPKQLSPVERVLRARMAAHVSWANTTDRAERTLPARQARDARFAQQVDPDNLLSKEERERRVDSARKAYFTRLAYLSVQSRRRKAQQPK